MFVEKFLKLISIYITIGGLCVNYRQFLFITSTLLFFVNILNTWQKTCMSRIAWYKIFIFIIKVPIIKNKCDNFLISIIINKNNLPIRIWPYQAVRLTWVYPWIVLSKISRFFFFFFPVVRMLTPSTHST